MEIHGFVELNSLHSLPEICIKFFSIRKLFQPNFSINLNMKTVYTFFLGNAYDPEKECGGSSGGEGSLIGSGGSILGLGSDVGGSLRNPAVFNGIYSLKPTYGRHLTLLGVSCI